MEHKKKRRARKEDMIIVGRPNAVRVVDGDIGSALKLWKQNMKANEKVDILKAKKEHLKPSIVNRKKKNDAEFSQWLQDKNYKQNNG